MKRKSFLIRYVYTLFKRTCRALGNRFKFFKELDRVLTDIEKSIMLYIFTREWLYKKDFHFVVVDGINYPTVDTIIKLHDFLVIKYERDIDKIHKGIISLAPLDFPGIKYWMEKNPDPLEDIIIRGAHIFNKFLEEGHPFIDGNKRTGWATLWIFLAANRIIFFFPNNFRKDDQIKKIEKWADYKEESTNIPEIVEWIKKYYKNKK